MNEAGVCVLDYTKNNNVYICLNLSSRYKQSKIDVMKNHKNHEAVFSKFRKLSNLSVFRERWKCLTCSFCNFFCNFLLLETLSKPYSSCTQNCIFYYFLGTRSFFVTKSCFSLCIYFFQKPVKIIKKLLDRIWNALSFSVHNIPTHFATSLIMKYQLNLQVFYFVIFVYILDVTMIKN